MIPDDEPFPPEYDPRDELDDECDFDYTTITLNAGTYCRTHNRYHFGV